MRRFFCGNVGWPAKTITEKGEGLTRRWARVSEGLRRMLTTVGLALAGRAGARLAAALGMPASRHRLIRLVRALPDPPVGGALDLCLTSDDLADLDRAFPRPSEPPQWPVRVAPPSGPGTPPPATTSRGSR